MSNFDNPDMLSDLPSSMSLDELFAPEPAVETVTPQAQETPQAASFRLETKTGSIYNSIEEATRGIEVKDSTIEQLRAKVAQLEGADPLKRSNQREQPQAVQPQAQQPESYMQNPERYLQDLVRGAETDPRLYADAHRRFVMETTSEAFAPVADALQRISLRDVEDRVKQELPDFQQVSNSPEYQQTLQELPDLAQAIEMAKGNFSLMDRLPTLYKTAYLASKGRQLPTIVEQMRQAPPTQPQTAVRPSMTTTSTPPPSAPTTRPSMATSEGRKALIAELEARGIASVKF